MGISFTCDGCGETVSISSRWAGKPGLCPRCRKPVRFPDVGAAGTASGAHAAVLVAGNAGNAPVVDEDDDRVSAELEAERQRLELERARLEYDRAALEKQKSTDKRKAVQARDSDEDRRPRRSRRLSVQRRIPRWVISLAALAAAVGAAVGVLLVIKRPNESLSSLVPSAVRGLEGDYRVVEALGGITGQRVVITGRTIEFPGRGADLYEDLGGGRLVIKPASGIGGTVFRWRWDRDRLLLWDAALDEKSAVVLAPE